MPPATKGDIVRVEENGGEYIAEVLSLHKHEDPDGNQLYGVKVLEMLTEPNYDLSEGQSCNVYPLEAQLENR